ncbi:MAG: 1-acyl-sn-glycerol-3-phosphate acyltransferase [Chitinophagaceae bacterium]
MKKILQRIFLVYIMTVFVLVMMLLFPFMLIASLFGKIRGGNMIYALCTIWGDICFTMGFAPIKIIYEGPHDKKKTCIFVINHISYLDAALLVTVIRQPARVLAKAEIKKIPLFGFIYGKAVIAVERDKLSDRTKSLQAIKSLLKKNISVVVFPEGTFNMTSQPLKEFYNGAFRVAIETQTPIKPVLFLDNFDRMPRNHFNAVNPGRIRVVYLDEIPVDGLTSADISSLKNKVFEIMSSKLKEYGASWTRK